MKKSIFTLLTLIGILVSLLTYNKETKAYNLLGASWLPAHNMNYYVNTASISTMNPADALVDIQSAAIAWTTQTNANWTFTYAGTTNRIGFNNDGFNTVFFTNETNAMSGDSYFAFTGCWWNGSLLLDCDIKVREQGGKYFTVNEICDPSAANGSYGIYLIDLLTHEFGHTLSVQHSDLFDATMHIGIGPCETKDRTLDPDDIAAISAIYGLNPAPSPTPSPVPAPSPSPTPQPAPQPPPPTSGATLTVRAYKVKGLQKADLIWLGLSGSTVDVYRNNQKILSGTTNDGIQTDAINKRGGASYTYRVCELASTDNCTNNATAQF